MPAPFRPSLVACALLAATAVASRAQEAAPPASAASGAATLPEVKATTRAETATGYVPGYAPKRALSATKTDSALLETPQAVTIVSRDQITDTGAIGTQDALNYAAGVRSDAYGLDTRADGVRIRGSNSDEYLDGLRKGFDYYTSSFRTDPYTLERIEVLRGPSGMLFGQGNTGGLVNLVSKRPEAETAREVGVQFGSYSRRQIQADLTGPLTEDGRWLYRVIAVGRDADTQVDHVRDDRRLLAPSLTWRPDAATSLTLQALLQRDRTASSSQFFPWSGTRLPNPNGPLPSSRFIGEPNFDRYDTDRDSLGWLFEHHIDERWTVRQNLRYARNEVAYWNLYGDAFTLPGGWAGDPVGQRLFGRFASAENTQVRMLNADQHVEGRLRTGPVEHTLLLGVDLAQYRKNSQAAAEYPTYYGGPVPLIDAYAPVYVGYTPPALAEVPGSRQRQLGAYLQDQMRFDTHWLVVAGLRHDRSRKTTDGNATERAQATTKRLGLMYTLPSGWAPYLSYSESFTPQADRTVIVGGQPVGQSFKPLRGEQVEAGLKYEAPGGGLSLTATAFDLREKNVITEPLPGVFAQLDATRNKGLELEFKAALARTLDVTAFYTYSDYDDRIEGVPRHQAGAWGKWRFSVAGRDGFSVGAGVRWFGAFVDRSYLSAAGGQLGPDMPSVALLDALLAWDSPQWRLALNVNNLTDKTYLSTCLGRGDCWFGARRNVVASATYRF